jgi:hypothetical protein
MKTETLDLTNDVVEILHNPMLKYRPFLLRLINFNNEKYELRLDYGSLQELIDLLSNVLKTNE